MRTATADIAVIKKTNKNFYDRIGEVSDLVPHEIPLDILVYTRRKNLR